MAEAAGLILTAIGTGLSLISLLQGNLKPADHGDTQVKLTVACADIRPEDNADSVSGKVDLRLYTRYGEEAGPPSIDNFINGGNTAYQIDYTLSDEYHGNQTPYIKVTGNTDAICIAWMTMTWSDGTDWVWDGQNGGSCGVLPWHYNDAVLGDIKQSDDGYSGPHRPDCSWIDGDGSIGGDTTAFSFYMPHFTTEDNGGYGSRGSICSSPNLATYQNDDGGGLTFFSPPPAINNQNNYDGRKKRDSIPTLETRNPANANGSLPTDSLIPNPVLTKRLFTKNNTKLIQSPREQHSAVRLCESDLSWGASFISTHEQKFCDMSTKTVYDLCTPDLLNLGSESCFDLETLGLRGLRSAISFNWEKFEKWGDEEGTSVMKWVQL